MFLQKMIEQRGVDTDLIKNRSKKKYSLKTFLLLFIFLVKKIKITLNKLNSPQENIRPYTDLSVKCCDDLTYWGDSNQCFSVGKCSAKSVS